MKEYILPENIMELAEVMQKRRINLNLSFRELEKISSVNKVTISNLERTVYNSTNIRIIHKLCYAIDIEDRYLIKVKDDFIKESCKYEKIGKHLKKLRLKKKYSRKDLAKLMGLSSKASIYELETRGNPRYSTLDKLSKILECLPIGIRYKD